MHRIFKTLGLVLAVLFALAVPVLAVAQTAGTSTVSPDVNLLISLIFPVVVGAITTLVMRGITKFSSWVNTLATGWQQILHLVIAAIAALVVLHSGIPLPNDLSGWSPEIVSTLVAWLASLGLHMVIPGAAIPTVTPPSTTAQ